jgi:putative nucleotidyltransferase with HDIG domain
MSNETFTQPVSNRIFSLRKTFLRLTIAPTLLISLLLLILVSAASYIVIQQVIRQQLATLDVLSERVNRYLDETGTMMSVTANIIVELSPDLQNQFLKNVREDIPRFTALHLLDINGRVIAEDSDALSLLGLDLSGETFFNPVSKDQQIFFSNPYISLATGRVAVSVAVPVMKGGEFQGVLGGEIDLAVLRDVLQQLPMDAYDVAFIVDQRGTLVAHPNLDWVQQQQNFNTHTLVQEGLSGYKTYEIYHDPALHDRRIGYVTPLAVGWVAVVTRPVVVAFRPIFFFTAVVLLALGLRIAIFIWENYYRMKLIIQPIASLARVADDVSRGEYQAMPIQKLDQYAEIFSLSRSFTRMVQAVQERTSALEQTNRSLEDELSERKKREQELEVLVAVSTSLRTANTRHELLSGILDRLTELLHAGGVAFAMREANSLGLMVELAGGIWHSMIGVRLPEGQGISGLVMAKGEPYISEDILSDPDNIHPELHQGLKAAACLPLIAYQKAIGLLWLGRKEKFSQDEFRLLIGVANMTANAIHRLTLQEQTEKRLRRLDTLRVLDKTVAASLDLQLILHVFLDHVTNQLGVDAAALLLYHPVLQESEYAAVNGVEILNLQGKRIRLGDGLHRSVIINRKPVRITNLFLELQSLPGAHLYRSLPTFVQSFQAYDAVPLITKGQLKGVLELFHRSPPQVDPEWEAFLEILAGQAAMAIDDAQMFSGLQKANMELILAYDATIEGWSRALDLRDKETEGHTQRVMEMTIQLAQEMGFSGGDLVNLRRGALLHDIGKMGVPDRILNKPGPLSEDEWFIMRKHPEFAYEMLSPITYLNPAIDIPYCHHEHWDGSGYPRGLKGTDIPLSARIFSVVDVWDALCSNRPYRAMWEEQDAWAYIQEMKGVQFDPQVVEIFKKLFIHV